jgi:hypothetical protein
MFVEACMLFLNIMIIHINKEITRKNYSVFHGQRNSFEFDLLSLEGDAYCFIENNWTLS